MSFPAKSRDVCSGCRSRKKKCDGIRPACSSCQKRGDLCMYTSGKPADIGTFNPTDWGLGQELDPFSFGSWQPTNAATALYPLSMEASSYQVTDTSHEGSLVEDTSRTPSVSANSPHWARPPTREDLGLPTPEGESSPAQPASSMASLDRMLELVSMFFEKFYFYLPVIHKESLVSKLKQNGIEGVPRVLLLAILSITAKVHPDVQIRSSREMWYAECKDELSKMLKSPNSALQTLQAATIIVFESSLQGECPVSFIVLAEAWRKAVAIGYSQTDGKQSLSMSAFGFNPDLNWIEREESRRVAWLLFAFDRGLCFPFGLVHTVDDRRIVLRFPMPESMFQGTEEPEDTDNLAKYSTKLDTLVTSVQQSGRNKTTSTFSYVLLSYALLGKISEEIYSIDFDYMNNAKELDALSDQLTRINLMLPSWASDLSAANYTDFSAVIWLRVLMSVSTILLHHRGVADGESVQESPSMASQWPHCVATARGIASLLRDAARSSINFIANDHMGTAILICVYILNLEYTCPSSSRKVTNKTATGRDASIKADLDVMAATLLRLRTSIGFLGTKLCRGLRFFLNQDAQTCLEYKAKGARHLMATVEQWPLDDNFDDLMVPE